MKVNKDVLLWVLNESKNREPFPSEVLHELSVKPEKEDLNYDPTTKRHSLKKAWMVERLNAAFGVGGWSAFLINDDIVGGSTSSGKENFTGCSYVLFTVPAYSYYELLVGGTTNLDKADSVKGGMTDVLSTVMMHISEGARVIWKGEGDAIMGNNSNPSKVNNAPQSSAKIYVNFANGEWPENEQGGKIRQAIQDGLIPTYEKAMEAINNRGWVIGKPQAEILKAMFQS